MSTAESGPPKVHFFTTFVLPALLVFLVPVASFFFFHHAQGRYDAEIRESILKQVHDDPRLTKEQRERAVAAFTKLPISRLFDDDKAAETFSSTMRFHYATFRWMVRLSTASIAAGIAVFLLAGSCVVLSLYSQRVQYLSLSAGWHVLRIFCALQVLAQGILVVALSFWVTALWFERYFPKLIAIAGFMAVAAVWLLGVAIFRRVKNDLVVEGEVLPKDDAAPIWEELRRICDRVGARPPDQIIAGIDDNFFVTENPVIVGDTTYHGRTLFVSLSLLKQLQGGEAEAVLAHEMAHFSGQDTLYSGKIAPLLGRYDLYLQALHQGAVGLPIYYFMLCFRALYQLSLRHRAREREFRADRIAAETTSARDCAAALLRIVAYSKYRGGVELDLFKQERALESADVRARIEQGFRQYAECFVSGPEIGQLAPAHPFDSHPPLSERLRAIGMPLGSEETAALLAEVGDGRWYESVPMAERMETEQWQRYQEQFRLRHEESLPYRFLPETDEERAIVVKAFPPLAFAGKQGTLTMDYLQLNFDGWSNPIRLTEITNLTLEQNHTLKIQHIGPGKKTQALKLSKFPDRQEILNAIQRYYGRAVTAVAHQKQWWPE